MKIGIYGGTFDPPHNGHIAAARAAMETLALDRLLLIPTFIPPHKALPEGAASPRQRLDMTVPKCDVYISQYVRDEVSCGESEFVVRRTRSLDGVMTVDGGISEVVALSEKLLTRHAVPASEGTDASHIATAAVYGMDVLLTWNCRHMANPVTLPKTAMIIGREGYSCPVIITPQEFLDRREEFLK